MTLFDLYAFADYSGAASRAEQRKRIAWCVGESGGTSGEDDNRDGGYGEDSGHDGLSVTGHTRAELLEEAQRLLAEATASGKRVLLGFDHNYSFPAGLYEAAAGEPLPDWRRLLDWLADSLAAEADPASGELRPRLWAARTNAAIAQRLGTAEGPFWGPHFAPSRRRFPFAEHAARLPERRVAETRRPGMKPVYQLGGAGSVGLQSLYGMAGLRQLLRFCQERGIPLHAWPFDGWTPPPQVHVMVEVYPTIYRAALQARAAGRAARRTDRGDAVACVRWARDEDRLGRLAGWLAEPPGLTSAERLRIPLEGWVLGVR